MYCADCEKKWNGGVAPGIGPVCECGSDDFMSAKTKGRIDAFRERIANLEGTLTNISEYWNQDRNDESMHDACWHAVETARQAIVAAKE